jgi:hypothetical protein
VTAADKDQIRLQCKWKRPYPGESEIKAPAPFVKAALRKTPDADD